MRERNYLAVKNNREVSKVPFDEIMYILRDGRRLIVVTPEREYIYYEKIQKAREEADLSFYRVTDGCLVNLLYVKSVDTKRRRVAFLNGDELSIGRDNIAKLKRAFYAYLIEGSRDDDMDYMVAEEEVDY